MKSVIYETRGRAREFCELAMNHYKGCGHQCVYCYGPDVTKSDRAEWYHHPYARLNVDDINRGVPRWSGKKGPVLLCFVTDPYQPIDEHLQLTRQAIQVLNAYDYPVHILTKAGMLARRDFDLLAQRPDNAFATTLTFNWIFDSWAWELKASTPLHRMANLDVAYSMGIPTWVSLEPVIEPDQTFQIIKKVHPVVGHFKVGTLNYHPAGKKINWPDFGRKAIELLESLGARYYIKKDLARHLGRSEGFWGESG